MECRQIAAWVAALAFAAPALAFDPKDLAPVPMLYASAPPGFGIGHQDREFALGLQAHGAREYKGPGIDSKILNFLPAGGLEAKWLIAGELMVRAAIALAGNKETSTQNLQAQHLQ